MIILILLSLLRYAVFSNGKCIGEIIIGRLNDTDIIRQYEHHFNKEFHESSLFVPVILLIRNDATNLFCPFSQSDVSVTCTQTNLDENGYSQIRFHLSRYKKDSVSRPVQLNIFITPSYLKAGREVGIRCSAESDIDDVNEFHETISQISSAIVDAAGKIEIQETKLIFPVLESNTPQFVSFTVKLSTTAILPVRVMCYQDLTDATLPLKVKFTETEIPIGQISIEMRMYLQSEGNSIDMFCTAASLPINGPSSQFLDSNSRGSNVPIIMQLPSSDITPQNAKLSSTRAKAYITLDTVPITRTRYFCILQTFAELFLAEQFRNTPKPCLYTGKHRADEPNIRFGNFSTLSFNPAPTPTTTPRDNSTLKTTSKSKTDQLFEGYWSLVTDVIIFEAYSERHATLNIIRSNRIQENTEYVAIRCCAPITLNLRNRKYVNSSVSTVFTSTLEHSWSTSDIQQNITKTSVTKDVCPCDLLNDMCDLNCCCDELCDDSLVNSTFACIPGVFGGYRHAKQSARSCDANLQPKHAVVPMMHRLLCVRKERSSIIGSFYREISDFETNKLFETAVSDLKDKYDFNFRDSTSSSLSDKLPASSTSSSGRQVALLSLPASSAAGSTQCLDTAALIFPRPTSVRCSRASFTSVQCTAANVYDATALLQVETSDAGNVVLRFAELPDAMNEDIGEIQMNYLCVDSDDLIRRTYFTSDTNKKNINKGTHPFSEDLPVTSDPLGEQITIDCRFNSAGVFKCGNDSSSPSFLDDTDAYTHNEQLYMAPRCSWDDGTIFSSYSRENRGTPQIDPSGQFCNRVLVGARYLVEWSDVRIERLTMTLVVADRVYFSKPLNQHYQVTYKRYTNETNYFQSTKESILASGNPGYEDSSYVITGIAHNPTNVSEDKTFYSTSSRNRVHLWKPDASGLCSFANSEAVKFKENSFGGCFLRLESQHFENCDYLRKLILFNQDRLMSSTVISSIGNPDLYEISGWVPIFRQDLNSVIMNVNPVNMLINETALTNITLLNDTIENAEKDYFTSCTNIPSAIHLTILYTESTHNDPIVSTIHSSKISYSIEKWIFDKHIMPNTTQQFLLSSTVNFVRLYRDKIPKDNVKKHRNHHRLSAEDDHLTFDPPCSGDTCWSQLWFPLIDDYTGHAHMYTSVVSMFSVLMALVFAVIVAPSSIRQIMNEVI